MLIDLKTLERRLAARENELDQLDAIAGDGDHGLGMLRGVKAALAAAQAIADQGGEVKALLIAAGEAWSDCGVGNPGGCPRALGSQEAALATASLLPRLGRARPHTEKSFGHPDPGEMSFAYVVMAVSQTRKADSEG